MDAEFQVALPWILGTHRYGWQHYSTDAILIEGKLSGINCHIVS
jgi:hypothetical protein